MIARPFHAGAPGPLLAALLVASQVAMTGCAAQPRLPAVPPELQDTARIPLAGADGAVRYRVGDPETEKLLAREFIGSWRREREHLASQGVVGPLPPAAFLAISGGGDHGAFAAGVLNGWTAAGNRPQFKLVTGISTGALIAPFAFLGPAYDPLLREFYTNTQPREIVRKIPILSALTGESMADTGPLREKLRRHVNRAFLDAVAAEYRKGRELWIATTDLDNLQRYIWNMTRIASSPAPAAVDLFVSVMLASASIPGAFPPVLVDVEAAGRRHQEMHVDGGTMAQVFVYPVGLDFEALAAENDAARERTLYVIRNARLEPEWNEVQRRGYSIAGRAIEGLIRSQGVGDLYRIYLAAQRDGLDFNLAYIPASFNVPRREQFDQQYMNALFRVGYDLAAQGYPWEKMPPHYSPPRHHQ
jgi:predicted acylesterase/phospholipase RssA